jgi:spore coat protein U-like protein
MSFSRRTLALIAVLSISSSFFSLAHAAGTTGSGGNSTANMQTTANVTSSCQLDTWTNVNFGNISVSETNYQANQAFNVVCTKGSTWTVQVGAGNGLQTNRYMLGANSNDKLYYNLYTDTTYTTIYGDGTQATSTFSGTGSGQAQTNIIQVKMAPGQFVTPDNYSDTITLTINY